MKPGSAPPAAANGTATKRAVFRSAEDLYSQLPVRDVVRVLAKTKEDAEKKREELRDLVGRRYHDLIDSADAIINMNDTVVGFEKMLFTIDATANSLFSDLGKSESITTKQNKANESSAKRKYSETETPRSPRASIPGLVNDSNRMNLVIKAPTEIWCALERGDELKAAQCYVDAEACAQQLRLNVEAVNSDIVDQPEVFRRACEELQLDGKMLTDCVTLANAAQSERRLSGEWQMKFPFLVSQVRLLKSCRRDIVRTCAQAFAERQISASRVERAMEALMVLGEISNPLKALLKARSQAVEGLTIADEESIFAIAELASRTSHDCAWMKSRFQASSADADLDAWMNSVASPAAKLLADAVCRKTTSMSALASLQRSLKETIKKIDASPEQPESKSASLVTDEALFVRLFGPSFQERAAYLLNSSHDVTIRKVKKVLNACGPVSDAKRNDYALRAFAILEQGLESVERDASELQNSLSGTGRNGQQTPSRQWLLDLISWLTQRPTPVNGRFAELLLSLVEGEANFERQLTDVSKQAIQSFAESLVKRLGDDFEQRATLLPWSKEGLQASSAMIGGWKEDPTHGQLPTVPSWPASEFCFAVGRELDAFTDALHRGGQNCIDADVKGRRIVGDLAWRRVHSVYSSLAKDATGADGKLQAAFDLEFATLSLLDQSRPPLPFTQGGVDVYACADILRHRAKMFASSSRLLHSSWALSKGLDTTGGASISVHETQVGGHNLLALVEPVPRFALLPMPQKRSAATPSLMRRSSSQISGGSEPDVLASATNASASSSSGGGVGLRRVLGWLS